MSTVTPFLNLVKPAPLENFSRATYNNNLDLIDTGVSNLNTSAKHDRIMQFVHAGFAWGTTAWDAGPLTIDNSATNSSQNSSPVPSFAGTSVTSGNIKFNEPGLYIATWLITPSAEPGISGYRIAATGTWPGPLGAFENIFGQEQKDTGAKYFESYVVTKPFRVPTANLEIRFTGIQTNGTTNGAKISITQLGKF